LKPWLKWLLGLFLLCIIAYAGMGVTLLIRKNDLLYYPPHFSPAEANAEAQQHNLRPWKNAKAEVIGWILRTDGTPAKRRCIIFHGQGGSAFNLVSMGRFIAAQDTAGPWEIFLHEYVGFGARPGRPSERIIVPDAIEALDLLTSNSHIPVYVLGQSLGSGIACQVASARPDKVAGLILVSPFYNLGSAAQFQYPLFPAALSMWGDYRSDHALKAYRGPVVFTINGLDSTISPRDSLRLHDEYAGSKLLKLMPETEHCVLPDWQDPWWREMTDFLISKEQTPNKNASLQMD
jgi:pimeloyl-ACP methyl ester carboxylesterase